MSEPTFSVIIPSHNGADRIWKALDSCVSQSYQNFELIVVCDACDDNTADIARGYGATVVEVDVHRDGLARNAGIDIAKGEWILFLDDDDWWLHEFVFQQLWELTMKDSVDVINYAIIWRTVGYKSARPGYYLQMAAGHCWKRTLIGTNRFDDRRYSSDTYFLAVMRAKNPNAVWTDLPMYYYNYMREGSLSERHKNGEI